VPADGLWDALTRRLACLPLIAEDLGTITADVREAMERFRLPGMRVLQFAFGEDFPNGSFLPHNHARRSVVYTGTHDNNTARGWFTSEAGPLERRHLADYLGREPSAADVHWEMIRLAMASVAETAVIPLQDLLGLGESARMNRPASTGGNWQWRAPGEMLPEEAASRLSGMTRCYGRAPESPFPPKPPKTEAGDRRYG
jgi:4-alpha-glucanotransferase